MASAARSSSGRPGRMAKAAARGAASRVDKLLMLLVLLPLLTGESANMSACVRFGRIAPAGRGPAGLAACAKRGFQPSEGASQVAAARRIQAILLAMWHFLHAILCAAIGIDAPAPPALRCTPRLARSRSPGARAVAAADHVPGADAVDRRRQHLPAARHNGERHGPGSGCRGAACCGGVTEQTNPLVLAARRGPRAPPAAPRARACCLPSCQSISRLRLGAGRAPGRASKRAKGLNAAQPTPDHTPTPPPAPAPPAAPHLAAVLPRPGRV